MINVIVKKFFKFLLNIFILYICLLFFVLPIRFFLFEPRLLQGIEQGGLTGIKENQYVLVDKIVYKFRDPQVGELILFKDSQQPSRIKFSRVFKVLPDSVEVRGEKWSPEKPSISVSREFIIGRILTNPFLPYLYWFYIANVLIVLIYFLFFRHRFFKK